MSTAPKVRDSASRQYARLRWVGTESVVWRVVDESGAMESPVF